MNYEMALTSEEKELVEKYRAGYLGVYWHKDDFEQQAIENEKLANENGCELKYNRSQFDAALDMMICDHDASLGISWDTVSDYLDTYCK